MTLRELKKIVDKTCECVGDCGMDEIKVVVPVKGISCGTPCVGIKSAGKGIDWDGDKFMIWTKEFLEKPAQICYIKCEDEKG